MKYLSKLARMRWVERAALLDAAALVAAFGLAVRVFSFERVRRFADRPPATGRSNSDYASQVFPWAADAVGRRFFPTHPCLPEALAVLWRTRGAGLESDLRIGFSKDAPESLQAHAWVEHAGRVLVGGTDSPGRYAPLESLGDSPK